MNLISICIVCCVIPAVTFAQSGDGQTCYEGFANFDLQESTFGLSAVTCVPGFVCGTLFGKANIGGQILIGFLTTCRHDLECSSCPDAAEAYTLGHKFNATLISCNSSTCCDSYLCNLPTPSCPKNQIYSDCAGCDRRCEDVGRSIPCTSVCRRKCTCPSTDMVLHGETCIMPNKCPNKTMSCPSVGNTTSIDEVRSAWICEYVQWRIFIRKKWIPSFNNWQEQKNGRPIVVPGCPDHGIKCKEQNQLRTYTDRYMCTTY
uniref:TIL domain-containing protein n=1 Tax=Ciona savignyi TaxID=51511 RepID=H2Z7U6_CIOSA